MTQWTDAADFIGEREEGGHSFVARYAPGALAFALSAALGVYLVYFRPFLQPSAPPRPAWVAGTDASPFGELAPLPKTDASPFGGLAPVVPPPSVALAANLAAKPAINPFGALVMKGFGSSTRFAVAEAPVPLPPSPPADLRPSDEAAAPLPPRRPSALARSDEPATRDSTPATNGETPSVARLEPKPAATSGLFEKLFGGSGSEAAKAPEQTLAYAAPPPVSSSASAALGARSGMGGTGGPGNFLRGLSFSTNPTSRFGDHVAVYDISARMVYLPDGTRIEAHSGLGTARDDPAKVNERMRGPTPPATYALSPREALFHGVAALRLTPIDSGVFGRAGLLAHTYMLGPDGDSNGCISFKDYDAFLRAYRSGEITKLVVVSRL
jgi:hypothetical protein